jgi:hypothetical protein
MPLLSKKYGIWREIDTSKKELSQTIEQMKTDLVAELKDL